MHTRQDQEKNAEKKGFIVLIFAVLSALAIAAPLTMKLEEKGVIESAAAGMDLGEPPFHTGFLSGVLNSIERFKWGVKNAYTNYMPGYSQMVVTCNEFLQKLNKPLEFLKTSEVDYPLDMPPEEEDPMTPPGSSTMGRPPEASSPGTPGDSSAPSIRRNQAIRARGRQQHIQPPAGNQAARDTPGREQHGAR